MNIASILAPETTKSALCAASKKRAIEEVAMHIAAADESLTAEAVFEGLISREKLGTTAIGHGIAIPHCRMESCSKIVGGLFRLETPVDFDAFDDQPVSLMFVLLVPDEEVDEHLQTLAMLASSFESETFRQRLLTATDDDDLYQEAVRAAGSS